MGKLQKINTEKTASIFDAILSKHVPLKDHQPEMKQAKAEKTKDRSWETLSDAKKLAHSSIDEVDLGRGIHSIRSAACGAGGLSSDGGSGNFIGANKSASMSASVLDKIQQIITAKEATIEEKRASKSIRQAQQSEFRNANSPKIGDDFATDKGSSVTSNHTSISGRYAPGMGRMSIFDNSDFERVQDLPGEKMEKRHAKKDDSWQQLKKAQTMKDASDTLLDALAEKPQDSGYKSVQKSTTDRLFAALTKSQTKKE